MSLGASTPQLTSPTLQAVVLFVDLLHKPTESVRELLRDTLKLLR